MTLAAQGRMQMRTFDLRWTIGALVAACALPAVATADNCGGRPAFGLVRTPRLAIVGLTDDQRLVQFRECNPERFKKSRSVTGLVEDDTALVGIDYRVQDGLLYGVGNGGGVYTLDPATGAATKVSELTVALDGTSF